MVFRVPESDEPPEVSLFLPAAEEVEDLVVAQPRRELALRRAVPRERGARAPAAAAPPRPAQPALGSSASAPRTCWRWRRATGPSRSSSRPTGKCLRDVFDLPGLTRSCAGSRPGRIRVVTRDTRTPSPFAASLLFSYVANFIYDGDAPLAERRAQALSVDQAQLRELLGEAELRELFDPEAIESLERSLQRLEGPARAPRRRAARSAALARRPERGGDPRTERVARRGVPRWLESLVRGAARHSPCAIAGEARFAAAEDAARLRDALGIVPPPGLPAAFLEARRAASL